MDKAQQAPNDDSNPQTSKIKAKLKQNRLAIAVGLVILALLVSIFVLANMLLSDSDDNNQNNSTSTSQTEVAEGEESQQEDRKIVHRQDINSKIEMVIYEPEVNNSNVIIRYAYRNVCDGCESRTFISNYGVGISPSKAYLLDNDLGEKYNAIKDQDNKTLTTSKCSKSLYSGQELECFIGFTKPSPGADFSIYFGGTLPLIDGFTMPN